MKYALIASMALFVISSNAASSSSSMPQRLPITLIHPVKTFISSINFSHVERHSGKTLLTHINEDALPVLARVRCRSNKRPHIWLHRWCEGRNLHNNLMQYNETHKKRYQLDFYLVNQKDNGKLVGLLLPGGQFIGRDGFPADRNCVSILQGQNAEAQVAAGNLCMEYKAHDDAIRWYKQVLNSSPKITKSEQWHILRNIAHASFATGNYEDAITFGSQASDVAYGESQKDNALKIIFRSLIALRQWDKAIEIGAPFYAKLRDDMLYSCSFSCVINDLAYAYWQKGQLYEAFDCALDAIDEYDLEVPDKEIYVHAALNLLYYVAKMRADSAKDGSACGFSADVYSKLTASAAVLNKFSVKHAWIKVYRQKYHGRYHIARAEAQRYLHEQSCQDDETI